MPSRRIIIFLFILVGLAIRCTGKTNISEKLILPELSPIKKITKVQGSVSQASQSHVSLSFYRDFISLDQASFQIPIDSKDKFAMDFLLAEPTICILSYNNVEIQLFLEPGDELVLDFENFRPSQTIKFSGIGAKNNTFLHFFQEKFKYWDSNYLTYEMLVRTPTSFRRFMNSLYRSKWNFYQNYKLINGAPFTKAFHHYMNAELDYWWAYHLLLYRVEHPLSNGLESSVELPENYFDFLKNVMVSNDHALNNRNYIYFLDQYMKLAAERPALLKSSLANSVDIVVDISSMLVLKSPDQVPILDDLNQGTRLRYLGEKSDFQSQTLVDDVIQKAFWYKVKTPSGVLGWILGVGIHFEEVQDETSLNGPSEENLLVANSTFRNAQKYLKSKARYFTQANDLYWRSHVDSSDELLQQLDDFLHANEYQNFSQVIYPAYAAKLIDWEDENRLHFDTLSAYSIIEEPRILTTQKIEKSYLTETTLSTTNSIAKILNKFTVVDNPDFLRTVLDFTTKLNRFQKSQAKVDPSTAFASISDKVVLSGKDANLVSTESSKPKISNYVDLGTSTKKRNFTLSYLDGETVNGKSVIVKLVLYSDPIQFNENTYELNFGSAGKSKTGKVLKLSEMTTGFLEYKNEKLEIYLEPGDHLKLRFHPDNFLKTLKFTGKGSDHNNYLLQEKLRSQKLDAELKRAMKEHNYQDFTSFMQEARATKLKAYHDFVKQTNPTEGFTKFAKADIDYWYSYQLMNYPWEHPLHNDQDAPLQLPDTYYDFMEEIPAVAKGALPNKYYTYYLAQLFDHLLAKPGNEGLNELELIEKYLSGEPLFYYRAKILSMACRRGKTKETGPKILSFIKNCPFELYNEILREVYLNAKGLMIGDLAPDFNLNDIKGQAINLSDYKGKVIYLDFWASWCSPCIMQIRNSRQWKKKFKNKDVVFIYVSLDKDKNAWRNFLRNEQLDGVHLIVPEASAYQSPVARLYKVKRLPAYYLIDKEGKINYGPDAKNGKMRIQDRIQNMLSER